MKLFFDQFPDVEHLLSLKPEDVVPTLLRLALARGSGTMFLPKTLTEVSRVDASAGRDYPHHKREDVRRFLERAWRWAESNNLVEPATSSNGRNGWKYLTGDGEALARGQSITSPRPDTPAQDEWISAATALALLRTNHEVAARTICTRAHAGLAKARAVRFIRDGGPSDNVDVPIEFWWAKGEAALHQNWTTGDFDTWIDQSIHLQAFGVTFRRSDIEQLKPVSAAQDVIAATPTTPASVERALAKAQGGRPSAGFWDDLWVEIACRLYGGSLIPKTQADIERAMHDYLASSNFQAGETTIRDRARKLWRAIQKDE